MCLKILNPLLFLGNIEKKLHVWSFERKTYTWSWRKSSYFEIRRISCEIHPKPYKIRCFNKNSLVWGVQGGGYDPGYHEILNSLVETFAFIRFWVDFTWNLLDFMKSTRFHVKSKDHLQGIVTLCLCYVPVLVITANWRLQDTYVIYPSFLCESKIW